MHAEAIEIVNKLIGQAAEASARISQLRGSIRQHYPDKLAQAEPKIAALELARTEANAKLNQLRWTLEIYKQVEEAGLDPKSIQGHNHSAYQRHGMWYAASPHVITSLSFKDGTRLDLKPPVYKIANARPKVQPRELFPSLP